MEVKSPYNFVPAPKDNEVFYPDWADQVSHDIPFSDGESGEIEVTITAETPIFIRNGHAQGIEENEFSHYIDSDKKKKYFIPATSIKGMLRNVMEIMTMGKMEQVDDDRHSVRQIMRTAGVVINEGYELANVTEKRQIQCGYLVKKDNIYNIYSCGQPLKIRYTDLDKKLHTDFESQFGAKLTSNMKEDFEARTGRYKYETILNTKQLEHQFALHPLNDNEKQSSWVSVFQHLKYARFFNEEFDDTSFFGRIVCVGQASEYSVPTARRGEYVFKGKRTEVINDETKKLIVSKECIETFHFVNRHNKKESEELKDWTYWKDKTKEGIPVFFRANVNNEIIDFGLSFMYKQPTKNTVNDLKENYTSDKDLAETIFGKATKSRALKGRVYVSNMVSDNAEPDTERRIVQSSPKSSFTPFYLKQDGNNAGIVSVYKTYNTDAELRGFKRYPIHIEEKAHEPLESQVNLVSYFTPLRPDTVFTGKIRFHNLRPVEVGAIISALTFHKAKSEEKYFHNLGYAKAKGYGKVSISIKYNELEDKLKAFELEMKYKNPNWEASKQMNEFLAIAKPNVQTTDLLNYMPLDDFKTVKESGLYLKEYSEITSNKNEKLDLKNNAQAQNAFNDKKNSLKLEKEQQEKQHREDQIEYEGKLARDLVLAEYTLLHKEYDGQKLEQFISSCEFADIQLEAMNLLQSIRNEKAQKKLLDASSDIPVLRDNKYETIEKWAKEKIKVKGFKFTEEQKVFLVNSISKSFIIGLENTRNSKFHKNNDLLKITSYPWTDITKWLDEPQTKTLYTLLTQPK